MTNGIAFLDMDVEVLSLQLDRIQSYMDEQLYPVYRLQSDGMLGLEDCLYCTVKRSYHSTLMGPDRHPLSHSLLGKGFILHLTQR
ncbi:hypothetical protein D1872_299690 [compost metagenome]